MVEGARLESEAGYAHGVTPKHLMTHSIQPVTALNAPRCDAINVGILRRYRAYLTQFLHSS